MFRDRAFHRLAALAGLDAAEQARVFGWPNTGVLLIPTARVPRLLELWLSLTDRVAHFLAESGEDVYFLDTIALALALGADARALVRAGALGAARDSVHLLPVQLNAQLNLPLRDFERNGFGASLLQSPALLLHGAKGTVGLESCAAGGALRPFDASSVGSFPFLAAANAGIARFNERLAIASGRGVGTQPWEGELPAECGEEDEADAG